MARVTAREMARIRVTARVMARIRVTASQWLELQPGQWLG